MELSSVAAIARALQDDNIRYLVVGGLAVNAHGYQRFTSDLDLVIQLNPENTRRALESLQILGYKPRVPVTPEEFSIAENRRRWHEEKGMLVLNLFSDKHRRTPIDIFISEPFDFDIEWEKSTSMSIDPEVSIPVISLDALLIMKKDAGRTKDLLDIEYLERLKPYRDGL